jgi:hypothetical protein
MAKTLLKVRVVPGTAGPPGSPSPPPPCHPGPWPTGPLARKGANPRPASRPPPAVPPMVLTIKDREAPPRGYCGPWPPPEPPPPKHMVPSSPPLVSAAAPQPSASARPPNPCCNRMTKRGNPGMGLLPPGINMFAVEIFSKYLFV